MEVGGQRHVPAALLPGKAASTYCIGAGRAPEPIRTGAENLAPKGIRSLSTTIWRRREQLYCSSTFS
jgi:hypothetical protein